MKSEKEIVIRAKLEKKHCVYCNGIYYVKTGGKAPVYNKNIIIRPRNAKTCSHKCSILWHQNKSKL